MLSNVYYHGTRDFIPFESFDSKMDGSGIVSSMGGKKYGGFFFSTEQETAEYFTEWFVCKVQINNVTPLLNATHPPTAMEQAVRDKKNYLLADVVDGMYASDVVVVPHSNIHQDVKILKWIFVGDKESLFDRLDRFFSGGEENDTFITHDSIVDTLGMMDINLEFLQSIPVLREYLQTKELYEMQNLKENLQALITESVQKNDIVKYIKERRLINFRYDSPADPNNEGLYRNVEPYVLGISKAGNLVLRAWQTNLSSSTSGKQPNWRLFRVDGISELLPVPQKFSDDINILKKTRPGYNQNDHGMVKVIASVAPLTASAVNKTSKTVGGDKVKTTANDKSFFKKHTDNFSKKQSQKKTTAKDKSAFTHQASKMKIPIKKQPIEKKKVDKGWIKGKFDDFAKKQIAKSKQKKKGFSKL